MKPNTEIQKPKIPAEFDPYDMALKKRFSDKADEINFIGVPRKRPILLCGAKRKGHICKHPAGFGTEHPGYGRCKHHGGCSTGPRTPEGKAKVSQNSRVHGLYAAALSPKEVEIFNELAAEDETGLKFEILTLKTKIVFYLTDWRRKWDGFYKKKLAETSDKVHCKSCGKEFFISAIDGNKHCPSCREYGNFVVLETKVKKNTPEDAAAYADSQTKVFYSYSENGARSYYHASTVEDKALDRALNTLRRLVETYNRLNPESGDGLVDQINAELRAASHGTVQVSWGGKPQERRSVKD